MTSGTSVVCIGAAIPGRTHESAVRFRASSAFVVEPEIGGGDQRAVGDAGLVGHRGARPAAIDEWTDEEHLGTRLANDINRFEQRRAARDRVLGDHDQVAGVKGAGNPPAAAVVLYFFADTERFELAAIARREDAG